MVHARLHLICGNCGGADDFEWRHIAKEAVDGETMQDEDVYISCRNCVTIHSLNTKAKRKEVSE